MNGAKLEETVHATWLGSGGGSDAAMRSTVGWAVYQSLEAGHTLHLQTDTGTGYKGRIMFCIQFMSN